MDYIFILLGFQAKDRSRRVIGFSPECLSRVVLKHLRYTKCFRIQECMGYKNLEVSTGNSSLIQSQF